MSVPVTITGTTVLFPSSGQEANWSGPVVQFAQLVADALSLVAGPFDVFPQIYTMVSNANTNVNVTNLSFPTSNVRAAFIRYTVYRNTNSTTVTEAGNLIIVYNPSFSIGSKWSINRVYTGDASINFNVTDTGQIQFSTTSIAGTGHVGTITYSATSLLNA